MIKAAGLNRALLSHRTKTVKSLHAAGYGNKLILHLRNK